MATPAHRLIQDQNLNVLYNGPTPGGKADIAKADKKGRLAGRKALNDISNSRKPTVLHSVKKDNSASVISIEKDPVAVKAKLSKATEKGKVGGRKALTDVTNSVKPPPPKQGPSFGRKLNAVAEENVVSCMAEERFLHNHQECIKAQAKAVDRDYFLKSVGLNNNDIPMQISARRTLPLSSKEAESNTKHLEMEEIPLQDQVLQCCSPACRSPQSPKAPYMSWDDDKFSELMVIETPKLLM
ncbi:hypothetical protein DH2020_044397 [Rehmannia glutinosa]|uniref:Uncharacterized protein n=1 Tax=Rehmannia glutinosa TaxID=99300 RepID=A0ABR0UH43_REHGL